MDRLTIHPDLTETVPVSRYGPGNPARVWFFPVICKKLKVSEYIQSQKVKSQKMAIKKLQNDLDLK